MVYLCVEELIGEATYSDKGLMPAKLYKQTAHYVQAFNATYKIIDYTNSLWSRDVIMICTHIDSSPLLDIVGVFRSDMDFYAEVKSIVKREKNYKYYKKDNALFICFLAEGTMPNNAYIMTPYGVEKVGGSDFIDESFTEITIGGI